MYDKVVHFYGYILRICGCIKKIIKCDQGILQKILKHTDEFFNDEYNHNNIITLKRAITLLNSKKQKVLHLMIDNVIDT